MYGAFTIHNRADGQFHEIPFTRGSVLGITNSGRHKYPARGGWAGVSERISLDSSLDIGLEGWAQLPSNQRCFSDYQFVGSGIPSARVWDKADSTWWYADAAVYFSWVPGWRIAGWSQVAGLRYDYFFKRLRDPGPFEGPVPAPFASNPSDTLEMTATWVTPYVGIEYRNDTELTVITLRFLAAPCALGTLEHEEHWLGADPTGRKDEASFAFGQSWFFEGYCDGACHVTKDSTVGGFMKMSHIDATSKGDFKSTLGSGVQQSADSALVFRRLGYAFGVKVDLRFAMPL